MSPSLEPHLPPQGISLQSLKLRGQGGLLHLSNFQVWVFRNKYVCFSHQTQQNERCVKLVFSLEHQRNGRWINERVDDSHEIFTCKALYMKTHL